MRWIIAMMAVSIFYGLACGSDTVTWLDAGIEVEGDLAIVGSNYEEKRIVVDVVRGSRLSGENFVIDYSQTEDVAMWDSLDVDILRDPSIRMNLIAIDKVIGSAMIGNTILAERIQSSGNKIQVWRNSTDIWCLVGVVVMNLWVVCMVGWLAFNYKRMIGEV